MSGTVLDANVENRAKIMPEAAETVQEILKCGPRWFRCNQAAGG
jgi:hypothetical protein